MKNYEIDSEKEEKNKKRGLLLTIFVHIAVVGMAFIPMMGAIQGIALAENTAEFVDVDNVILEEPNVDFVANVEDQARKNESNEESKTTDENETPEPTPTTQPEPEAKDVEVVEDKESPSVVTTENPAATEVKQIETPKVDPTKTNTKTPSVPTGTKSDKNKTDGKTNNNTNASGDGGDDNKLQEGVFGRRVTKRPNIKGLTKYKGRIAIKICVSQHGTVIASKFLNDFSTLYDAKLIAAAVKAARRYKFDVDYTAPEKQWGKLTFVFDV
jgi:outer membrane biosynthesis protein TonB